MRVFECAQCTIGSLLIGVAILTMTARAAPYRPEVSQVSGTEHLVDNSSPPADKRSPIHITVDFAATPLELHPLWRSTGFSPAELLLTRDMDLMLRMVGASRGPAIRYIRPHYLLDLVKLAVQTDGTTRYDFTELDQALDRVVGNDLRLIFELMASPSSRFDDFRNRPQVLAWKALVAALAEHLLQRYGKEQVESWYFETTNEPDIHPFWPQTAEGFLNYYDASSEGLKQADPKLRFGGPGAGRFMSTTLKALLEHCESGVNTITGERGVRIDFLSFHVKALPHEMVRMEEYVAEYLKHYHPKLAGLALVNDEADAQGGWGIPYWWQAGSWPAAFAAQSIDLHYQVMVDRLGSNLILVGADHGFLGTFGKRTLTARFLPGDNDAEQWGSSDSGGWKPWDQTEDHRPVSSEFYLVRKPAFTVMSLAALLGEHRYQVSGFPPLERALERYNSRERGVGCLATRRKGAEIVLMCYNAPPIALDAMVEGNGMVPTSSQLALIAGAGRDIDLELSHLPFGEARLTRFQIDPERGNPYSVWQALGSPTHLTSESYRALQQAEPPPIIDRRRLRFANRSASLHVSLPGAAVTLIVLSPQLVRAPPAAVRDLAESQFIGASGERISFLRWHVSASPAIETSAVYYASPGSQDFAKIDTQDLLDDGIAIVGTESGGRVKIVRHNLFGDASLPSAVLELK